MADLITVNSRYPDRIAVNFRCQISASKIDSHVVPAFEKDLVDTEDSLSAYDTRRNLTLLVCMVALAAFKLIELGAVATLVGVGSVALIGGLLVYREASKNAANRASMKAIYDKFIQDLKGHTDFKIPFVFNDNPRIESVLANNNFR